jgi:hypothetical protein
MNRKIAVIGGGISGVISSIKLARDKTNTIHLYEKRNYLLKGPPYCHLHAGGILYPEISIEDAQKLLSDSIDFANYFSDCLEYRPTVVAYRSTSNYCPSNLLFKCKVNKISYQLSHSHAFGKAELFYAVYTKDDIVYYKTYGKLPESDDLSRQYHDKYVENFCKLIDDINSIKYPFVSVCEPGINQEKVEEKLLNTLNKCTNVEIFLNNSVNLTNLSSYDTIINASGNNIIDKDTQQYEQYEQYEFKSSWVISSPLILENLPEIAVIGERETSNGMIQLTPIKKGIFQVHCMTKDSTIIDTFHEKTDKVLSYNEIEKRGGVAIRELSKVFSVLIMSKVEGACPGIQRIPYNSKSKRISQIKYTYNNKQMLIDIQTLKACSVISIINKLEL